MRRLDDGFNEIADSFEFYFPEIYHLFFNKSKGEDEYFHPFHRYLTLDYLYLNIFGGFIPNMDQYLFDSIDYFVNWFIDYVFSGDLRLYGKHIHRRSGIIEDFWYPDTRLVVKQPFIHFNVIPSRSNHGYKTTYFIQNLL